MIEERKVVNGVTVKQTGHIEVQWSNEIYDPASPDEVKQSQYHRKVFDNWQSTPNAVKQWVKDALGLT